MNKLKIARVATRIACLSNDTAQVIERHIDQCRAICEALGITLDDIASRAAVDACVSGHTPWRDRPGLRSHYEAAQRGEFSHLIVAEIKHLGRDEDEISPLIEAFEGERIEVFCGNRRLTATRNTAFYTRISGRKRVKKSGYLRG